MQTVTVLNQTPRGPGTFASASYDGALVPTPSPNPDGSAGTRQLTLQTLMQQVDYRDPGITVRGVVEASWDGGATWRTLIAITWVGNARRNAAPAATYSTDGPWPDRFRGSVDLPRRVSIGLQVSY